MKYYQISGTDLKVSSIIMGCMRIDGLEKKEIERLVMGAMEQGVNFFDHADVYGGGECEKLFAEALDITPTLREKMILQGKCGIRKCGGYLDGYYDFSEEYILQCVDEILSRLHTDYLDVLLLHRPDSLVEPEEVGEAFEKLENSGKVRNFGLSNASAMQFEMIQRSVKQKLCFNQIQFGIGHTPMVDAGMAANTFLNQGSDRSGYLLEYSRMKDVTLQAWSPFQHGFFEGVVVGDKEGYAKLNEVLENIGEKYGVSPSTIAVAWILRHPARMQVITGTTKISRMQECCKAADIVLTRAEWYEIYKAAGNPIP